VSSSSWAASVARSRAMNSRRRPIARSRAASRSPPLPSLRSGSSRKATSPARSWRDTVTSPRRPSQRRPCLTRDRDSRSASSSTAGSRRSSNRSTRSEYAAANAGPWTAPSATSAKRCSLKGVVAHHSGAHPNEVVDWRRPHLAVADLAGAGRLHDGVHDALHVGVVGHHLDAHLGEELHRVLGAPVHLGVAALASEAPDLGDGHAVHVQRSEGILHVLEL